MPSNYIIFRSHPCISMQKIRTLCLEEDDTDFFSSLIRIAHCCREGENPCEVTVEGAVCWELMWSLLLCQTVRLLNTSCGTQERQVAAGDREMGPAPPLISLTSLSLLARMASLGMPVPRGFPFFHSGAKSKVAKVARAEKQQPPALVYFLLLVRSWKISSEQK